ncbi:unknown [Bacillus thuringiensis phage MZTP02]|uniref:Uncharacterized protein n=1 Tax=Bacillus thuringiensis phage MZTP02 TaxID=311221 RepID=Q56AQ9_9CAUD|nr:unknown [Bacillus thuringiensis phage MZTP02]
MVHHADHAPYLGLGDGIVGPQLQRFLAVVIAHQGGEHHDGHLLVGGGIPQPLEQVHTIHARHLHIGDHRIDEAGHRHPLLLGQTIEIRHHLQPLAAVLGRNHVVASSAQGGLDHLADKGRVIHHQNGLALAQCHHAIVDEHLAVLSDVVLLHAELGVDIGDDLLEIEDHDEVAIAPDHGHHAVVLPRFQKLAGGLHILPGDPMDPADAIDQEAVGHLVEVGDDHHLVAGVRVGLDAEPTRQIHQRDETIPQGEDPHHMALGIGVICGFRHPNHLAHLGDVYPVISGFFTTVR